MPSSVEHASELDNLLQIIAGTTSLMENIWGGRQDSGKYLTMLRESVDRAAAVTAKMVEQAGGATDTVLSEVDGETDAAPALTLARRKQRILVVDDEPMMRTLFEQLFTEAGYEVVLAESGFQALDFFTRDADAFDLVVLDFTMPFMGGEETFRQLRAVSSDLPIAIAAGFMPQRVLDRMLASGLTAFMRKPIPPDELLCLVAKILGRREMREEGSTACGIPAAS